MLIQLETITFNHDPNPATADALNIRIDRAQTAPGWIRGAVSSAAAYTLAPAAGRALTIAATFSFPGTLALPNGTASVMVRMANCLVRDHLLLVHEVYSIAIHNSQFANILLVPQCA